MKCVMPNFFPAGRDSGRNASGLCTSEWLEVQNSFFLSEKTVGEDPHSASNFYKIFKRELQSIFLRTVSIKV
jgi:hypothetical protein